MGWRVSIEVSARRCAIPLSPLFRGERARVRGSHKPQRHASAPHPDPLPARGRGSVRSRMRETLTGVPEGLAPVVLARLAEEERGSTPPLLLHVARDDRRLEALAEGLAFFAPKVRVIQVPAWDTVPYDRVGPNAEIVATRIAAMARLAAAPRKGPTVVLTTVNAILQRLPPREFIRRSLKNIAPGQRLDMQELVQRLNLAGFQRTGTVMEPGEYAVRGSILDLFPPGRIEPRAARFRLRDAGAHQGLRSRDAAHGQDRAEADPDADQRGGVRRGGGEALPPRLRRGVRPRAGGRPALRGGQRRPALHRHGALAAAVPRAPGDAVRLCAGGAGELRSSGRGGGGRASRADRRHLRGAGEGAGDADLRRAALQAGAARRHVPHARGVGRPASRPRRAPHDAVRAGRRCGPHAGALVRRPRRAQFRPRALGRRGPQRVRRGGSPCARAAGPGQAGDRRHLHARRARAAGDAAGRAPAARYPQDRQLHRGASAARRDGGVRRARGRARLRDRRPRRHRRAGHPGRPSRAAAAQSPPRRRCHHRGHQLRASATSWCTPTTASAASTGSPPSPRWAPRTTAWRSPTPRAPSSICLWKTSSF